MFDLTPERDEALEEDHDEDGPRLVCAVCRATVARVAWIGPVLDGPARRVFFSPAGVVMEVVTLRRAVGVRPVGPPTTEFTWFPGFAWRTAHCEGCAVQLGWRFDGASGGGFWALLTRAIDEEE